MTSRGLLVLASLPLYVVLAIYYLENYGDLHLPAPSFKKIGPPFTAPSLADHKGVFTNTGVLRKAEILYRDQILGSESVAVSKKGDLCMIDRYGVVWESSGGGGPRRKGHVGGGRPLGFHFDHAGNLVVCNTASGLHLFEKDTGRNILLTTEAPISKEGSKLTPIRYANDLDIAADGTIFFSDSCDVAPAMNAAGFYDTMATYILNLAQGEKSGRLLKYDPKTKKTSFLLGGLHFANGVALGPKEEYVLVVETSSVRVSRYWLKGAKAGQGHFHRPPSGLP